MKKSKGYQMPEVSDLMSNLSQLNDWQKKFVINISKKSFEQLSQKQMQCLQTTWSEWKKKNSYIELDQDQVIQLIVNRPHYSEWELSFYESIKKNGYKFTSEKQAEVVDRLLSYSMLSNNTQDSPVSHGSSQTNKTIKHTQIDDIGLDYTQSRQNNSNKIVKFYDGDAPPW